MVENRWIVLRKVRNGRVKIGGKWFYPTDKDVPYTGQLEGLKIAFGRYRMGDEYRDFISLWGTERMFNAKTEEESKAAWDDQPNCINGYFYWEWWNTKS